MEENQQRKEWYVVNTYAGHENRVKENLVRRIDTMGLSDYLFRIVVAEETYTEIKGSKTVQKTRNLFPGYLFVEMIMTDQAWYIVRNTPGVTGFIGSSGGGAKPFPVAENEINAILRKIGDRGVLVDYEIGDRVKILDGSFKGSEGVIDSIDAEKLIAHLNVFFFGRETPVEIELANIKKVETE